MIDKILEGYLHSFADEYDLSGQSTERVFEHFINYCVISKMYAGSYELKNIHIDDGGQLGLDGMAIIVNDHLVTTKEEVDGLVSFSGRLNADFIFIQAKTSSKFDMGDMSKFFTAVEQFFQTGSFVCFSESAQNLRDIHNYIYSQSIKMEAAPVCHMFYASTGAWTDDKNLMGLVDTVSERLRKTNSFSKVQFTPLDAEKIKTLYRTLKNKTVKQFEFEKYIVLPKIDDIQESFIGIAPCKEFLKLICDDEGALQKNLFYDNVRDFQGSNPVNVEIGQTLKGNAAFRDKFVVLNNGITIVTKAIGRVGSTFKLIDYQIVNGCQTSHIIFNNKDYINDNVYLPIKLIVTANADVTNAVTKATNRQTVVNVEAFETIRDFHKELEAFYSSFDDQHRLYYERRSKQYDNDPKIKKNRVISLAAQIQSFISMFLLEPHSTHRYYGELLKVYREDKKQLFMDNHSLYPYYISGYALHILEKLFSQSKIDGKYKQFKYQFLMLLRLKNDGGDIPIISDTKKMNGYCSKLQDVLWDLNSAQHQFQEITHYIDQALKSTGLSPYEAIRRRNFSIELESIVTANKKPAAAIASKRQKGIVKWFDDDRGYGFIQTDKGEDVFVHYSAIWGSGYKSLVKDQAVELQVVDGVKGSQAKDVEVLVQ